MEFPYVRIGRVNEIVKELPINLVSTKEEFTVNDISKLANISKSAASNLIVTLKALKFVEGKRRLKFTENGTKYIKYLIRNDEEKAKQILKEQIEKLEYFQKVLQKLRIKGKLTIEEIGNMIALQYDTNWKNPLTVKTYGAAIASILDFVGFGTYRGGILSLGISPKREELETMSIIPPDVNISKIFKILKTLFPNGADIHSLSKKLKTEEKRLSTELGCCILLGLVRRTFKGYYELTDCGVELIKPLSSEEEKKTKFRQYILSSPYRVIIEKLLEEGKTKNITTKDIGDVLEFYFKKNWSEKTKIGYAKKFLNWLKYSEIVIKDNGSYSINTNLLRNELNKTNLQEEKSETKTKGTLDVDKIKYYLLGKSVGLLLGKTQEKIDIDEIIGVILVFCKEKGFEDIAEDWKDDYKLYKDIKDLRIFLREIKALEKMLGVMKA